MLTDGRSLLIESLGRVINASEFGQLEIPEIVVRFLERIQHDRDGEPVRLFPITRFDAQPRDAVVIDPRIDFGQPRGEPRALLVDFATAVAEPWSSLLSEAAFAEPRS